MIGQGKYLEWNDETLEACEGAPCPCGHVALDHHWSGCEDCICAASGIHVVLISGALRPLIRRAQTEAWDEGFDAGERDVWEHRQRGFREDDPCIPNPYLAEQ